MVCHKKLVFLTLLATCCLAAETFAQPGGRGRGGGFFGRGGGTTELLMRDEVREEIMLVDDQVEQLEEVQSSFRDEIRSVFTEMREEGGGGFDREKIMEVMQEKRAELETKVNDILLPHQLDRLKQLSVQSRMRRGGAQNALESDEARDRLGISDEQLDEIREVAEKAQEEMQEKVAKLQKEAREKVLAVLTPEQRELWKEMIGDDFTFAERNRTDRRGGEDRGRARGGDRGQRDGESRERRRGFGRRPE